MTNDPKTPDGASNSRSEAAKHSVSMPVTRWSVLDTQRYPSKVRSSKREGVRSLRFYNDNKKRQGRSGRLAASIAWFDSINEARYVLILIEPGKRSIKLVPQTKPVVNTRLIRYKNGEVFIGGGYQLRKAGYSFGRYVEYAEKNVFELTYSDDAVTDLSAADPEGKVRT